MGPMSVHTLIYILGGVEVILVAAILLIWLGGRRNEGDGAETHETNFVSRRGSGAPNPLVSDAIVLPTPSIIEVAISVFKQLLDAIIVLYSIAVLASTIPSFQGFPNIALVPYYLLVPGFVISGVILDDRRVVARAFSSVIWSLALVAAVYSLQETAAGSQVLPPSMVVSGVTLLFFAYGRLHRRRP